MYVWCVTKALAHRVVSTHTDEYTQEKSLTSVSTVGKGLRPVQTFITIV